MQKKTFLYYCVLPPLLQTHPLLIKDPKILLPVNFPSTLQSKEWEAHQGQSAAKTLFYFCSAGKQQLKAEIKVVKTA